MLHFIARRGLVSSCISFHVPYIGTTSSEALSRLIKISPFIIFALPPALGVGFRGQKNSYFTSHRAYSAAGEFQLHCRRAFLAKSMGLMFYSGWFEGFLRIIIILFIVEKDFTRDYTKRGTV